MIRLLLVTATALGVVWAAGMLPERWRVSEPAAVALERIESLDAREELARIVERLPLGTEAGSGEAAATQPAQAKETVDARPLEPTAPEAAVPDDPADPAADVSEPRRSLGREEARIVRERLDRVMTLAAGVARSSRER